MPLIVAAATPADAQYVRLVDDIEQTILSTPGLSAFDWVSFSLVDSQVSLRGFVSRPSLKPALERRVRDLEGVASVQNEIEVLPQDSADRAIRLQAFGRIYEHHKLEHYSPSADPDHVVYRGQPARPRVTSSPGGVQQVVLFPIHILVRHRLVTLEGHVANDEDRQLAAEQAQRVIGVESVTNNLLTFTEVDAGHVARRRGGGPERPVPPEEPSAGLRVDNPAGNLKIQVTATPAFEIRKSSPTRPLRESDVVIRHEREMVVVECRPADGAPIDLDIDLPYGADLEASTQHGSIQLRGLVRRADLATSDGDIVLAAPWSAVHLEITAKRRPEQLQLPEQAAFSDKRSGANWSLHDRLKGSRVTYGRIVVRADAPRRIIVHDAPIPRDSLVKMHWQAPAVLEEMFRVNRQPDLQRRELPAGQSGGDTLRGEPGEVRFRSDVRMVSLALSVTDQNGQPVVGLQADDFEVREDGKPQRVDFVGAEEVPFNLVLLLDCSGSTEQDRPAIAEAARGFINVARPHDRVAVYALADTHFHVLAQLTQDRERLLEGLDSIGALTGGSPLYDTIVLSYAQELAAKKAERNALIVITDGVDNQLQQETFGIGVPSLVPYGKLRRAAAEMNALVYPVFLDPVHAVLRANPALVHHARQWKTIAANGLKGLADASGGRLFLAKSIRDLEGVYPQVAQELRSIYSVAYYPNNQKFDGKWRHVRVRVKRRGVQVRTRAGYYAW